MATVAELREQAEELGIDTDGLKKADLEEAIRSASFKGLRFKEPSLDLDEVTSLVDAEGGSFASAAAELETNVGEVAWHYNYATGPGIEADDPEELAQLIVAARDDEKDGWTNIAGRAGLTRGSVRKLYEAATGSDPSESDIGRGGRGPGGEYRRKDDEGDEPKPKKATKKAPAKKAASKTAAAKTATKAKAKPSGLPDWDEASEDDIRSVLEGNTVTTAKGDVAVSEVKRFGKNKAGKRVIQVETEEGDKANIVLTAITAVA